MKFVKPFGLGLKCDELTLVFRFPMQSIAYLLIQAVMIMETGLVYHPFTLKRTSPIRGFCIGSEDIVLMRGKRELMRMQIGHPDQYWIPALTVSYSPENVWLYGADKLVWKILNTLLAGPAGTPLDRWELYGHISQIDACFDVEADKNELFWWYSYGRKTVTFGEGDPSHYITKNTCKCQLVFYNKLQELEEKYGIQLEYSSLTRIEWRWHPGHKISFFDGARLWPNPLARLQIFNRREALDIMRQHPEFAGLLEVLEVDVTEFFSSHVKHHLSPYMRRKLFKLLKPATPTWWNPERIWEEWPATLMKYECAKQFTS